MTIEPLGFLEPRPLTARKSCKMEKQKKWGAAK